MATPRRVKDLIQDPKNRRLHGERNLQMMTEALETVGAARSIVIDEKNVIHAGNGIVAAAAKAGITKLRVVDADGDELVAVRRRGLTAEKKRLLAMYDNRASELSEWNVEQLQADHAAGLELGSFWTPDELERLFGLTADGTPPREDPDIIPHPRTTTIERGDLFELGEHRLLCGDSTVDEEVGRLIGEQPLDLVVSSPPYNVNLKYRTHKDKASRDEYLAFIAATARAFVPRLAPGRFVAWNIGVSPKTFPARQVVAIEDAGLAFYRQIVWAKTGVPYPTFPATLKTKRVRHYAPNYTHELIQVFEKETDDPDATAACALCDGAGVMAVRDVPVAEAHETVQLFTNGETLLGGPNETPLRRYQNDVWQIAQSQATVGLRTIGNRSTGLVKKGQKSHRVKEHPAAFPVEVPRAVMSFLTGPGETVFDPFGGSGSTLIACELNTRRARLMELDAVYCQLIIDRWEAITARKAVKVDSAPKKTRRRA